MVSRGKTYRRRRLRLSYLEALPRLDFGQGTSSLCPAPSSWWCRRHPCQTARRPPWTRRSAPPSVDQPLQKREVNSSITNELQTIAIPIGTLKSTRITHHFGFCRIFNLKACTFRLLSRYWRTRNSRFPLATTNDFIDRSVTRFLIIVTRKIQ